MKALVIHGFTGSLETVAILRKPLEARKIEVKTPVLRGHSSRPELLYKVGWRDWVADARTALRELTQTSSEPVVVAGLSMGALVGCQLAAEYPHLVKRLALLAPALAFKSKLLHALPLIKRLRCTWPASSSFDNPKLADSHHNYTWFPIESVEQLVGYVPVIKSLLPFIECPTGVFFSDNDPTIASSVPNQIEALIGQGKVTKFIYHHSHHELLLDSEAETIAKDVVTFLSSS